MPFVEAAGAIAHYRAERAAGFAMPAPRIDAAMDGLWREVLTLAPPIRNPTPSPHPTLSRPPASRRPEPCSFSPVVPRFLSLPGARRPGPPVADRVTLWPVSTTQATEVTVESLPGRLRVLANTAGHTTPSRTIRAGGPPAISCAASPARALDVGAVRWGAALAALLLFLAWFLFFVPSGPTGMPPIDARTRRLNARPILPAANRHAIDDGPAFVDDPVERVRKRPPRRRRSDETAAPMNKDPLYGIDLDGPSPRATRSAIPGRWGSGWPPLAAIRTLGIACFMLAGVVWCVPALVDPAPSVASPSAFGLARAACAAFETARDPSGSRPARMGTGHANAPAGARPGVLGNDRTTNEELYLSDDDLRTHLLVLGGTGAQDRP